MAAATTVIPAEQGEETRDHEKERENEYVYPASPELYAKAHQITPRYPKLDFGPIVPNPKDWFDNDTTMTEFYHSLSLVFPQGEKFFVQSVAHYAKQITDPVLKAQVKAFASQETQHSAQHWAFNKRIGEEFGSTNIVEHTDRCVKLIFQFVMKYFHVGCKDMQALAITCGLEHFTAMLANLTLNTPEGLETLTKMPPAYRQLWIWHAVEEIEHKAVAFDVYKAVGGTWWGRVRVFLCSTFLFPAFMSYFHGRLLYQRGVLFKPKTWWTMFKFLFISPGVVRRCIGPWLTYLRPGFHPWEEQNAHLIKEFQGTIPRKVVGGNKNDDTAVVGSPSNSKLSSGEKPDTTDLDVVLAKEQLQFASIVIE